MELLMKEKIDTLVTRTHEKLEAAAAMTEKAYSNFDSSNSNTPNRAPSNEKRTFDPLLGSDVMINTMKRVLGGDYLFVADGDADIDIASLAIHRRCPVLSNDSDFYIFPLQYGYIPYSKFHWSNPRNDEIYAELYFYELFCEQFGISDSSLLAVIPAIVGNDMIPQLETEHKSKILPPDPDCKSLIETVVMYTASFTTLEACIHTLQTQQLIDPMAVIENIQEAYNDYFFVPCKFCKPLDILRTVLECEDGSPLPEFVLKKFRVGEFSTSMIRVLRDREKYKIVIEDISESWCQLIGVPIRRAIYGILCGSDAFVTELQRGENPLRYNQIEIKSVRTILYDGRKIPLPSLESCGTEIEKDYGKEILFGILDVDADGLAEVDLGNGTNYNPQEALNMFFQTGSIIGRSFTSEGDMNPGKIPIQEINNQAGTGKLSALISTYNYYLQMMRDATGLNEARDGSTPDKNALVGVQKLAAANSNTATRHILQAGLFLTTELAEKLSLRIADVLEYSPTRDAFIQSIGAHNVGTLQELTELYIHDFGIFIELAPDEEEKQMLENNIQVAIGQQNIDLDDAIDIRQIKNIKLANQLLKLRRKKKQQRDQQAQQANIQAQAQANAQAQQVAAQAEVQKQQALTQSKIQLEAAKSEMDMAKLQAEAALKKELMQLEFSINMELQGKAQAAQAEQIQMKENAKAQQQPAKPFESGGNDILSGDFSLGAFDPK